jgi:hypothetical protein
MMGDCFNTTTILHGWKVLCPKRNLVLVTLTLLTVSQLLTAQESHRIDPGRFFITPIIGFRSSMSFTVQPAVQGTNSRYVIDSGPSYGFSLGLRVREDNIAEFRWSRQDSYAQIQDAGVAPFRTRLTLNEFHCDFSQEYGLGHRAPWARPFIMGSVGATVVSNGANAGSTHFFVGVGGGIKFFMTQHLAFRMQAEWLPIFVDPQGTASCSPDCFGGIFGSQAEIAVGPVFRF